MLVDLTGKVVEKLAVIGPARPDCRGNRTWVCRCECGNKRIATTTALLHGRAIACHSCARLKHGHARTREYATWIRIKDRCNNPNNRAYKNYGGRGITVCDRWLNSFVNFLADMGERPTGMSIERKDNDLGYAPANCKWATDIEQANNTRRNRQIEYRGRIYTISQLARESGKPVSLITNRINHLGWDPVRAAETPARAISYRQSLAGQRFGKLLVLGFHSMDARGNKTWDCLCQCGRIKVVSTANLHLPRSASCIACPRQPKSTKDSTISARLRRAIESTREVLCQ